jgi:hypothetical protein
MSKIWLAILAFVVAGTIAPVANACRVFRSPEQRISDIYTRQPDIRIALVRIAEARHLSNDMVREINRIFPDSQMPWRATASVSKLIVGDESPELVIFDRGWGSAACDDGTKKPDPGDQWVVYYISDHSIAEAKVLASYPLGAALRADSRLTEKLR